MQLEPSENYVYSETKIMKQLNDIIKAKQKARQPEIIWVKSVGGLRKICQMNPGSSSFDVQGSFFKMIFISLLTLYLRGIQNGGHQFSSSSICYVSSILKNENKLNIEENNKLELIISH